jgi:preprotein translocase subunit YajC
MLEDILIPLIVFATFFGIAYLFFTTRNKERMALIEKGADAKLFNSGKKLSWKNFALSIGMLAMGIGLGIILAAVLVSGTSIEEEVAYPSMIFLFAGISLVMYFFLARKLNGEDEQA